MKEPQHEVGNATLGRGFAPTVSALVVAGICGLLGCRINRGGHGDGIPNEGFYPRAAGAGASAAVHDASLDVGSSGENAAPSSGPGAGPALVVDAGSSGAVANDSGTLGTLAPSAQAGSTSVADSSDAGGQNCGQSLKSAVCDPIGNTGCVHELGMQCDVDIFAATLSGVCVFSAPGSDGGGCINIAPTETCPPGQTCVDGTQCSTICLCDTDCAAGSCCRKPIGMGGFKLCGPC